MITNSSYLENSDYTNISIYLKIKINPFLLFLPIVSNYLMALIFSSLLEVKITNRKLAMKLINSYYPRIIFLPFIIFLIECFLIIYFSINFDKYQLNRELFLIIVFAGPIFYLILNPIMLYFRNTGIKSIFAELSTRNKIIDNPYQIIGIKSWKNYLSYYSNAYKGNYRFRASEGFKPIVEKPKYFHKTFLEKDSEKSKDLNDSFYSLYPSLILLHKYFGSLFISIHILYLFALTNNLKKSLAHNLKLMKKYLINLSINFLFYSLIIVFTFLTIYNFYDVFLGIFIIFTTTLIYILVCVAKSIILRKNIKVSSELEIESDSKKLLSNNILSLSNSIYEIKQDTNVLKNNLKRMNFNNIIFGIWLPFLMGLILLIISAITYRSNFNLMWIFSISIIIYSIFYNYIWISILFYLAKKQKIVFTRKEIILIFLISFLSIYILTNKIR